MKKNILFIILFNIILIIVLALFLDLLFVYYKNNSYIIQNGFRLLPQEEAQYSKNSRDGVSGPANVNPQPDKRNIVFSGCSIAYGLFLPFEETIGYLVSELSGRKVFNRGSSSTCISHVLYELTDTKYYDEIENPEYMFFIYDPVLHSTRINTFVYNETSQIEYLFYKLTDNKLSVGHSIPFLSALSLYRHFTFENNLRNHFTDYHKALTIKLFEEVNNKIHEKFPDIHFIVIVYEGNYKQFDYTNQFYKDVFNAISDFGIEILSVNEMLEDDCSKDKYKSDFAHPNSIVWKKVAEKLVEKYNL